MLNNSHKREEVLYAGDNDGNTMLMDAIRDHNFELSCLLLEHYADPMQKNDDGQDSLAIAEESGFEELSFVIRDMQENGL
jgi:ankyrin repeat protein